MYNRCFINAGGKVVGTPRTANGPVFHAFVYADGTMSDLNALIDPTLGWRLNLATVINESGQIVGVGNMNGHSRLFLLTPMGAAATPEPGSLALGAFPLASALLLRRRKGQ